LARHVVFLLFLAVLLALAGNELECLDQQAMFFAGRTDRPKRVVKAASAEAAATSAKSETADATADAFRQWANPLPSLFRRDPGFEGDLARTDLRRQEPRTARHDQQALDPTCSIRSEEALRNSLIKNMNIFSKIFR
jgi:hypothetical protein